MKKIICIAFGMALLTCSMHAQAYMCSGSSHNADTTFVVLCAEDYNVSTLGGLPSVMFVDLQAVSTYSISGHIELSLIETPDFIRIREVNADMSTIRYVGSYYNGTQDIQVYTQSCRYLAIDVYCYGGAVSSTSGFSLAIRPTIHDEFEQVLISDKLGVGTNNPSESLEIVGNAKIRDNGKYVTISPSSSKIQFLTNASYFEFDKQIRSTIGVFSSPSTSNLTLQTDNAPRMTILQDNGYIGIGTTTPQTTLHVNGNIRGNGTLGALTIETETGTTTIGAQGWSYSHFQTSMPRFYFYKPIVVGNGEFSCGSNADLKLQTFLVTQLTIKRQNGYVGIGTEYPTAKLDVAGKIHASDTIITPYLYSNNGAFFEGQLKSSYIKANDIYPLNNLGRLFIHASTLNVEGTLKAHEVIVNTTGADFVFEDDYDLQPLPEVNAYIKENHHLPDIPSAAKMAEDGMNVNQMVVKLLQKVEELTLYNIQLEERICELEKIQK